MLYYLVPAIHNWESMDVSLGAFHSFRFFVNIEVHRSDYGDPSKPEDFDFMYPISPYHNVDRGDKVLPPMLLLTADRACSRFARRIYGVLILRY